MPACNLCGFEWQRDPVLEVECPTCHMQPGSPCVARAPSGHVKTASFAGLPDWGHDSRDLAAAARGWYEHDCTHDRQRPHLQGDRGRRAAHGDQLEMGV